MISTEITVGDKTVIDSGFVTALLDEQVQITLTPDDLQSTPNGDEDEDEDEDGSLTFIFEFIDDEEKEIGIDITPIDEGSVKYEIINHHNGDITMGGVSPRIGPVGVVEIGDMIGRELLLNYQVSRREAGKEEGEEEIQVVDFFYSFYMGGKVDE